ncbi:FtsK/SpoIIIE domain-containing protein [Pseudonocardia dioxanivorans]|nr:FtsK/SpoIIIE domain-containing protein [Pseudonocardia dioxanivorans]
MFVWLYAAHRTAFTWTAWLSIVVALVAIVVLASRTAHGWQHRRTYVEPLSRALAPTLGIETPRNPASWITVPRSAVAPVPLITVPDKVREAAPMQLAARVWARRPEHIIPARLRREPDTAIRVQLPDGFTGSSDAQSTVTRIVSSKLGIPELNASFGMIGKPIATFTKKARPPEIAKWNDHQALVRAASESAPLIGVAANRKAVAVDLDAESPHILISSSTGGGKSVMARAIICQGLHNGGIALVLDVKRVSHAWARGLPNVRYCANVADIHNALLWVRGEVERRYTLIDDGADIDGNVGHIDLGPRVFILAEEQNATITRLNEYWRETRESSDPKQSPAVAALNEVLFMGRACQTHVITIGQLMTARASGGPEARENYATRILARYSVNAWRMLVPECWPPPRSSRHSGRVQVVLAGKATETQVIFTTPGEAREYATSGIVTEFPALGGAPVAPPPLAPPVVSDEAAADDRSPGETTTSRGSQGQNGAAPGVTLSEAAEAAVPLSLKALRSARDRDSEFPKPIGKRGRAWVYSPESLARWERNRSTPGKQWAKDVSTPPKDVIDLSVERVKRKVDHA